MLQRAETGKALELGRNDLLQQVLAAERAVAAKGLQARRRRGDQELAIPLHVENVQRDRVDVARCQFAKHQAGRIAEELRDESRLLLGREAAQRRHEVRGKPRVVLQTGAKPFVGRRGDGVGVANVGEAGRQAGRGVRVRRIAGSEHLPLPRREEEGAAPEHGTAEHRGRIAPPELRFAEPGSVQKELVRVQLFMLEIDASRPGQTVRSRPDVQLDVAAAIAALRRRRQGGLHFDTFQRIERDHHVAAEPAAAIEHVGDVDAVQPQCVVGRPRAVHAGVQRLRGVVGLRAWIGGDVQTLPRAIRQWRVDAGLADDDVRVVARCRRQLGEHLVRKRDGLGRGRGIERELRRHDLHRLVETFNLQRHWRRHRRTGFDIDRHLGFGEAGQRKPHHVFAAAQRLDAIRAVRIRGRRRDDDAGAGARDLHEHPGQHPAAAVGDCSFDRAARLPRRSRTRRCHQAQSEDHHCSHLHETSSFTTLLVATPHERVAAHTLSISRCGVVSRS